MPESKTRKAAVEKKRQKKSPEQSTDKPAKTRRIKPPSTNRWVPPTFITVGLLGVAWLIVYYVAGQNIPIMSELGNWNILIGMGGLAGAFVIATQWK